MRNLSTTALELLNKGEFFAFLFDVLLRDGKTLHLTNYSSQININGLIYLPNSALTITKGALNDSAQDLVQIEGIFEENGINLSSDLKDAEFKIWLIFVKQLVKEHLLTLWCADTEKNQLKFILRLKNISTLLGQTTTKLYSKTCRATLGDEKCCVNLRSHGAILDIISIERNTLITNCKKPDGYYDYGKMNFVGSSLNFTIVKQIGASFILEESINCQFLQSSQILAFPGCDKTIDTCWKKFGNAVNFRGEPFVPEFNGDRLFKGSNFK